MERLFKDNEIINKIGVILDIMDTCGYFVLKKEGSSWTDPIANVFTDTQLLDVVVEPENVKEYSVVIINERLKYYYNDKELRVWSKNAATILELLSDYMLGGPYKTRSSYSIEQISDYPEFAIEDVYDEYIRAIQKYLTTNSSKVKSLSVSKELIDNVMTSLKDETSIEIVNRNDRYTAIGYACISLYKGQGGVNSIKMTNDNRTPFEDKPAKFITLNNKSQAVVIDDAKFPGSRILSIYKYRKKSCVIFLHLAYIKKYTLNSEEEISKFVQLLSEFYDDERTVCRTVELIQDIINKFQEGNNSKSKMPVFKHTKAPSITSGIKLGLYSSSKPADYEDYDITKSYMYNLVSKTGNVNLMHNREVLKNIMDFVSAAMKLNMENIERVIALSYMSGVTLKIDNPFFIKDEFKREVVIGNIIQHCTGDFQERLSLGGHILTK